MTTAFEMPSKPNFFCSTCTLEQMRINTTTIEDLMLKAQKIMIMISSAYVLYFRRGPYCYILDSSMNDYTRLSLLFICNPNLLN